MPEQEPLPNPAASAPPQTPQQVAEVLEVASERVFINHVAEKLRQKKTLTRQESNRLNAIRHGSGSAASFAANQTELAAILDISRKTIVRAMLKDDHPPVAPDGRMEVKPWRDYLARTNEHLEESDQPTIKSERARNLMLKNDKLEFELAVLRRDYRSSEEIEKDTGAMIGEARKVLNSGPSALAPQVVGVSIAEAEKLIREWVYNALDQLHNDPLGDASPSSHPSHTITDEPS